MKLITAPRVQLSKSRKKFPHANVAAQGTEAYVAKFCQLNGLVYP